MKLHFVTPGFRPNFIKRQLKYLVEYIDYDFVWHIIMDNKIAFDIKECQQYDELKDNVFNNFLKLLFIENLTS